MSHDQAAAIVVALVSISDALDEIRVELQEIKQGPASDAVAELRSIRERMP